MRKQAWFYVVDANYGDSDKSPQKRVLFTLGDHTYEVRRIEVSFTKKEALKLANLIREAAESL